MFFSFFTRFISPKSPKTILTESEENPTLKIFVIKEDGKLFHDFNLFHQDNVSSIDTLIFLPHFGIFIGETINWEASELKNATVERSTRQSKRPAATHLENIEAKIRHKLDDVLSFDSTPIHRFIWLKNLTETEFDTLDSSFHQLLPKSHLFFSDETIESLQLKIHSIGEYLETPLSSIKIIGALNSYAFILPTPKYPDGALLSPQQNHFLTSSLAGVITLWGEYGTGKSTLILRKALLLLLSKHDEKILIITPTLLGSELLRDEFLSIVYYGSLKIDLNRINFSYPMENFDTLKIFNEATSIFCDDTYLIDTNFLELLQQKRDKRLLLFSTINNNYIPDQSVHLNYQYRTPIVPISVECDRTNILNCVLLELRKLFVEPSDTKIILVFSNSNLIPTFKESIDEYLDVNCRILTKQFSLQYQDLDDIILTTEDSISGLSLPHLLLVVSDNSKDYTYALSRASESATIISYTNSTGESDAENH
ncbi:MAG: hypothetical protein PHO27_11550 [Sulfuricurvum sp.]|nr:hypothetical protein [Sulfuricurvum sp.]